MAIRSPSMASSLNISTDFKDIGHCPMSFLTKFQYKQYIGRRKIRIEIEAGKERGGMNGEERETLYLLD